MISQKMVGLVQGSSVIRAMFEEGKKELLHVVDEDWNNADAHYNLGVLYAVSTQKTEDAMYHLKQAFTLQPEFDQARYIYDMIAQRHN